MSRAKCKHGGTNSTDATEGFNRLEGVAHEDTLFR
jgi:hypothetical protein